MSQLERLEEEMRPFAQMLRKNLEGIEQEIVQCEHALSELREARRQLLSLARYVDPSLIPEKPKDSKPKSYDVSQEKYDTLVRWLQDNHEWINAGVGIYASGLLDDPRFSVIANGSQIAKALRRAHEDGYLRIDSMGSGGRKNYKVVG